MKFMEKFYDNTRISDFRRCPRLFYYRHIRDWTPGKKGPALIFGSAWHAAMDAVWPEMCGKADANKKTIVEKGYEAFLQSWTADGLPHPNNMTSEEAEALSPRLPAIALEMLYGYVEKRKRLLSEMELVYVERPFAVPLSPTNAALFYVGRLDKVVKYKGDHLVIEHKTTTAYKKDGPFRAQFIDSFSPNSQVDGYIHALHMLFGKKAKAVWIDASLVHKQVHDGFQFIPVERQFAQIDAWLWEAHYWINQIEENSGLVDETDPEEPFLSTFPKNTSSCSDYGGCPYAVLCKSLSNPAQQGETPQGFLKDHWSPFEELHLEQIGLKK